VLLRYELNPDISAELVASLRQRCGWEARQKKMEKIIGCTYLTAACFDDQKLIGFVDALSDGVEDALIRGLVVDPDYRRRGIAVALLNIVIERIKADQIKTVNVLFDEPNLADLYRKAGFRIVSGGLIDNEAEGF
jgi:aralkylamine N-acetyltransferase